ncbi:putative DMT superfamily transporter inner membrane protein [Nocardioides dokdonensis FR1436]|uniref:Putative DMT superfamily transporter inner membrane protein n=1 Tax=Nocardioides dokdonensis FR1436 TaxID=1300347 RepID=A0A1A9GGN9_9ACTN|nr:EamA family transporter RarD [Nocardioides dokdonensis]ANH37216.1 putative DMT superfamily transporter inner membrane protein [Nocardioides dokdonensis FR1436]
MAESRRGVLLGTAAYLMWGAFPLYFPLLEPAGALEMLGHRVVWSALTMTIVVVALHQVTALRALLADRRRTTLLVAAAATITVNWGVYIYGVTHGRVVETALGYYINPLVTVLLGVLVLGERMRRLQWIALGIAATAVVVLTIGYGRLPWVAIVLALSFGSYGLLKKTANAGAVPSLTLETLFMAPVALGYLALLGSSGNADFGAHGLSHALLLTTTGVVTAVPLLCFGAAATRIPLTTIGLLQYLTPTLQFLLGVLYFREDMPAARWAGFVLVWIALAMFTFEALRHRRRQLRLTVAAAVG